MSTTPRTDAAVKITIGAGFNAVCPNFARKLETELAAMQARAEKAEIECLEQARLLGISGSREAALVSEIDELESELAAVLHRIKELQDEKTELLLDLKEERE